MRNPKYIYKVGVWEGFGPDGYTYAEVRPHLADLAKEYSIESSQIFFRVSIEGKIVLVGNDFDIVNVPWAEPKYIFQIDREIETDGVRTTITEYRGEFFRTDCVFDIKNKTVQIKPTAIDGYTNVLGGLDTEYNLVELVPGKVPVTMYKRRITQVYMPGDNVVTNILDGVHWETECERIYDNGALVKWNWKATGEITPFIDISNYSPGEPVSDAVLGRYNRESPIWKKEGTKYCIRFVTDDDDLFRRGRYELYNSVDSTKILFATSWRLSGDLKFSQVDKGVKGVLQGVSVSSSDRVSSTAYVRWILEREHYMAIDKSVVKATAAIKANDHAGVNENYTRNITFDGAARIVNSENYSDTPTEWSMAPNGKYYMPPSAQPGEWYIPIARNRWGSFSIWYRWTEDETEIYGRLPLKSNDCYLLSSTISALLGKIAPGITHEPTAEYSRILYGDNPIGEKFTFLLTQKTNVLKANYTQAATKAPITLQSVTKLLQAYQMFWYIEDNKFKIEHILFFRNGGSYSRAADVGVDLTKMLNPSIRRTYADTDAANTYSFDKLDMPERYEFEWMDDTSAPFASSPIIINSGMAQPGKTEEISIGQFMPDIDFMMLRPGEVSQDGFAIMAATHENLLDLYLDVHKKGVGNYFEANNWYDIADGVRKTNIGTVCAKIPCSPGETYTLRYKNGTPTGGMLYMCYYDERGEWLNRGTQTMVNATFTTPENCYYVAVSFTTEGILSNPNWKDITQLTSAGYALPMVRTELPDVAKDSNGKGVPYTAQNGYMMWRYIIPKYWPYNLPSRSVIINGKPAYLEHISRKRKQENVKFPSEFDPDLFKLIRTNIGDGQIQKLSINLNSRMNTVQLNYDTE